MSCGRVQGELHVPGRPEGSILKFESSHSYIEKIRESIVPVLGSREEQRPLQYDDMKDLPFVHACFYEAVRVGESVSLYIISNTDTFTSRDYSYGQLYPRISNEFLKMTLFDLLEKIPSKVYLIWMYEQVNQSCGVIGPCLECQKYGVKIVLNSAQNDSWKKEVMMVN